MSGKTLADISTGPDWLLYLVVALFAVISLTLLLGRDKELVDTFRQAFSLSEDLYDYNERLAQR